MGRPLRIEYPGAFYHVFNRGLEKREIFRQRKDYEKFLFLCGELHRRFRIVFHTYCLMPNHYHLLVETPQANLSRGMRHLDGVYTQSFNRGYQRVGPLFQGRYKAILVEKENYALVLSRYIHLNPVKAGLCQVPEQYPFSSYRSFLGLAPTPPFLNPHWFLEQYGSEVSQAREAFHRFTLEGFGVDNNPLAYVKAGLVLGSRVFFEKIQQKFAKEKKESEEFNRIQEMKSLEEKELVSLVEQFGARASFKKKLLAYALRHYTSLPLKTIQIRVGAPSYRALSMMLSRLEGEREKDSQWGQLLRTFEGTLQSKMWNVET